MKLQNAGLFIFWVSFLIFCFLFEINEVIPVQVGFVVYYAYKVVGGKEI